MDNGPGSVGGGPTNTDEGTAPNVVIWGTDVSVDLCKAQFIDFLRDSKYTVETAEMDEARLEWQQGDEPRSLYLTKLEEILLVPNEPFLTVNCAHLKEYNEQLYRQLVDYPTEVIQIFDMGANELFQELHPDYTEQIIISVRPFNIDRTCTIRGLNPEDIGRLVTISGMVTRCSSLIPEMVKAFFKCFLCYYTKEVPIENGRINEPHVCVCCQGKFCFQLIHNRSRYIDRQIIKLQESPDEMPAGQTPSTISLVACADLVDRVTPGDRVYITGVYRAAPVRVLARQRKQKPVYRVTVDLLHFRKVKSGQLHDESTNLRLNPDRVDTLKALAKDENIYYRLAKSLCPGIFGHQDLKRGVLLQLFGGTRKEAPGHSSDPKLRHFRSDINILLCGDPGTSKSQILQYVYKLVPRGQYTSGKGSSAVGLTAYVTKDVDTKQLVLQTGALVMCDGGICCIDEFDKMSDSTRSVLHEVMEQQTISIAKAGIVCQLNARTSVLAAANPVESEWNRHKTVLENIRMPDTLLSRFDLVYLVLDPDDPTYDSQLAKHLVAMHFGRQMDVGEDLLPMDLVKDYLAYAKASVFPKLTEETALILEDKYIDLRGKGKGKGKITAYPRNLESLIRLSEAHARMRLSPIVEAEDVEEAYRLTGQALKHSCIDPDTGKIDDGMIVESCEK